MKLMLGSVEIMTNKRITLPKKLVTALNAKDGDFLLFYDDDGKITVTKERGYRGKD